jgi:hypothetical protein
VTSRHIRWDDLPGPIQRRVRAAGIDDKSFAGFRQDHERHTQARVVEGALDALVYYALQSTAFTKLEAIEPALSAKAFVEGLDDESRRRFLAGSDVGTDRVPVAARQRLSAFLAALREPRREAAWSISATSFDVRRRRNRAPGSFSSRSTSAR